MDNIQLKELQNKLKEKEEINKMNEKEFYNLYSRIEAYQKQFGNDYSPKWNFGLSRKCPACKSYLNKKTYDNIHILYVCTTCDYKYAQPISDSRYD